MKIQVQVKPNSRHESVEKLPDGSYRVAVNAPPIEGKANVAVVEAVARHFGVPKSTVRIAAGARGKRKTVEIG